jgi:hypothetical protein
VYIRFCGNGRWRFRSYSGSLLRSLRGPGIFVAELPLSRASSLPHGFLGDHNICTRYKNCGSELARDEASPFNIFIDSNIAFASRLAPTIGSEYDWENQAGYKAASRWTLISAPR